MFDFWAVFWAKIYSIYPLTGYYIGDILVVQLEGDHMDRLSRAFTMTDELSEAVERDRRRFIQQQGGSLMDEQTVDERFGGIALAGDFNGLHLEG